MMVKNLVPRFKTSKIYSEKEKMKYLLIENTDCNEIFSYKFMAITRSKDTTFTNTFRMYSVVIDVSIVALVEFRHFLTERP